MHGLEVLQLDTAFIAINKPAGLLSVPGRGELAHDSAAQRVQICYPDARVVHRLDMATSGIMLMAFGVQTQRALNRLFEVRAVDKTYVAEVHGLMAQDSGEIDLPLITDWPNRPRQKIDAAIGKPSLTRYRVLQRDQLAQTTRVELFPLTGRSHQLRVHLLAIGHHILGDGLYSPASVGHPSARLMLHATSICFEHPERRVPVHIESKVPF